MQMTIPKAYDLANRFESVYELLFTHSVGHISDCVAERINNQSDIMNKIFAHWIPFLTLQRVYYKRKKRWISWTVATRFWNDKCPTRSRERWTYHLSCLYQSLSLPLIERYPSVSLPFCLSPELTKSLCFSQLTPSLRSVEGLTTLVFQLRELTIVAPSWLSRWFPWSLDHVGFLTSSFCSLAFFLLIRFHTGTPPNFAFILDLLELNSYL